MKYYKFKHSYHLKEVDSTSLELKRHISEISNLTFLSADFQTAGKGRNDTGWISKNGQNLLFSFAIKNPLLIKKYNFLSLAIGGSIYKVLTNLRIENVFIKWPNDVYVKNNKIAGVLLEGEVPNYIIVGVGLNVNQIDFGQLYATSIKKELGMNIFLSNIKTMIYKQIRDDLKIILKKPEYLLNLIQHVNYLYGKAVSFEFDNEKKTGVVTGISSECALIIRSQNKDYYIDSGEVNLL